MPNVLQPTRDLARSLRRQMTLPEVMLWQQLRGSQGDLRFRRQHPMGRYVLDVNCMSLALAVETAGYVHQLADQFRHDAELDPWLEGQGVTVMRVPATDALSDVDAVV